MFQRAFLLFILQRMGMIPTIYIGGYKSNNKYLHSDPKCYTPESIDRVKSCKSEGKKKKKNSLLFRIKLHFPKPHTSGVSHIEV